MTYVVGWKDEKNVYVVADSALSSELKSDEISISSFGEIEKVYGNYQVSEQALKIAVLQNKYIISFAGLTTKIYSVLEFIRDNLEMDLNIYEVLEYAKNSMPSDEYELIIAFYDNRPILLHFNGKETIEREFVQIGSGVPVFRNTIEVYTKKKIQYEDPSFKLVYIVTLIQCTSIKEGLIKHGVGGAFSGIRAGENGISWCSDSTYCIYEDNQLSSLKSVTIMPRDNCVFVSSQYKEVVPNSTYFGWNVNPQELITKWKTTEDPFLEYHKSDFYIFYNVELNCIRIYYTQRNTHTVYFRLWVKNDVDKTHHFFALNEPIGEDLTELNSVAIRIPQLYPYLSRKDYILKFNDQDKFPDYEDDGYR